MRQRSKTPAAKPDPQPDLAGVVKQAEDHEARIETLEAELVALKQTLAATLGVSFDAA